MQQRILRSLKFKPIYLYIFVLVLLLFYFLNNQDNKTRNINQQRELAANPSNVSPLNVQNKTQPPTSALSYKVCKAAINQRSDLVYRWYKEHYESWNKYLAEDFTLDEITFAVEYFGNSNFAASFRIEHLRKSSEHSRLNKNLNAEAESSFPQLFESSGFSLITRVPAKHFANYASLPINERKNLITQYKVSIDDVAYFILDKTTPNALILELISALSEPTALVGYEKLETTNILDHAIYATRKEVVERLLAMGVQPTEDSYLGSSMEWALSRLTSSWKKPQRNDAIEIVKLLQQLNSKAKFQTQNSEQVNGRFPRHFFKFNKAQIDLLIQEHNLDLLTIEHKAIIDLPQEHELIIKIKHDKDVYISNAVNLDVISLCKKKIKDINNKWQANWANNVLKAVMAKYDADDIAGIKSDLNKIDPMLIDIYNHFNDGYLRAVEAVPNTNEYFTKIQQERPIEAFNLLSSLTLNKANKNWLFAQTLKLKPSYYLELVGAGYLVDEIPYFLYSQNRLLSVSSLTALQSAGVATHDQDIRGKTLLYYVVDKADVKLLKYAVEQHYPFKLSNVGEDPLHLALSPKYVEKNINNIEEIVKQLMEYNPEIDSFHLSKMKVLKLKYPQMYENIINQYRQLKILPNTEYPKVTKYYRAIKSDL